MQFIDILIATAYASICISVIVSINPLAPRQVAVDSYSQARLDSAIGAYIANVGLPFLQSANASQICESALQESNSTIALSALVQGEPCGTSAASLVSVSLSLELPGRSVVINASLVR